MTQAEHADQRAEADLILDIDAGLLLQDPRRRREHRRGNAVVGRRKQIEGIGVVGGAVVAALIHTAEIQSDQHLVRHRPGGELQLHVGVGGECLAIAQPAFDKPIHLTLRRIDVRIGRIAEAVDVSRVVDAVDVRIPHIVRNLDRVAQSMLEQARDRLRLRPIEVEAWIASEAVDRNPRVRIGKDRSRMRQECRRRAGRVLLIVRDDRPGSCRRSATR